MIRGRNGEAVSIAAKLRLHLPVLDRAVARAIQASGDVPCRRGCSACCQNTVLAGLAEGLIIAERLRGDIRDGEALRRLLAPELARLSAPSFATTNTPCLFLDGAECAIYSDRPIICRVYAAIGDREQCYSDRDVLLIDTRLPSLRCIDAYERSLTPLAPEVPLPLAVAVRLGLELLERGRRQFDRWLIDEAEPVLRPTYWQPLMQKRGVSMLAKGKKPL